MNDFVIKKLDKLETHDRYQHFTSQSFDISACCQDILNKRPFGDHPFYIFSHTRTDDDGLTKRLIWQPRLTKPKAQSNSMLFKGYPAQDLVKVIWIIPDRSLWGQYYKGAITENETVMNSITDFLMNKEKLEAPEADDLSDAQINAIYRDIALDAMRIKQANAGAS